MTYRRPLARFAGGGCQTAARRPDLPARPAELGRSMPISKGPRSRLMPSPGSGRGRLRSGRWGDHQAPAMAIVHLCRGAVCPLADSSNRLARTNKTSRSDAT